MRGDASPWVKEDAFAKGVAWLASGAGDAHVWSETLLRISRRDEGADCWGFVSEPLELPPCLWYGFSEDIEGVGDVVCVLVLVPSLPLATMRLSSIEVEARGDLSPEGEIDGFPSICFDCRYAFSKASLQIVHCELTLLLPLFFRSACRRLRATRWL